MRPPNFARRKSGIWGGYLILSALALYGTAAAGSDAGCGTRINDTPAKLAECIQRDSLWQHLKQFQKIADQNPGGKGHGNRNTGSSGYKASVDYVAGLMRRAGYSVTIQRYKWTRSGVIGTPFLSIAGREYRVGQDWSVARLSGSGHVTAIVQPAGDGCTRGDFAGFVPGRVALLALASCSSDLQVTNAETAGAAALLFRSDDKTPAHRDSPGRRLVSRLLQKPARIPVLELASPAVGAGLSRSFAQDSAPAVHIDIQTRRRSDVDYNVIADSRFGDPDSIVVIDAHLDSIYGAGMLDNASGSTTILETALQLARTKTENRLRYIWFGGEELGLLGSHFYTRNLSGRDLKRIAFDIDVDVTATPNFDVLVADPAQAHNADKFPPNVIPQSRVGNKAFADYFRWAAIPSRNARFGNDGTDSNSFSLVGVPNSGILTQQDCCKHEWEVDIWGGYLGNYEGRVPGRNGGCVDWPRRRCDNLSNNDPFVLEFVSKAVASVTLELANDKSLKRTKRSMN